MLTPVSLSIVRNTFTDRASGRRRWGSGAGYSGWRPRAGRSSAGSWSASRLAVVFWVNVPIGAAMLVAARRYVPESRAPRPRRVDAAGQLLMIVFLGSLTYAVIQGPAYGWVSPPILTLFAIAATALAAFITVEKRRHEPLLELRFFRSPPFTGASVIAVLSFVILAGFLFVITLYLQQARGYSPLHAGLALLPATAVMAAAAPVAGHMTGRRGPLIPLAASGILMAVGSVLLLGLGPRTSYLWLAVAFAVLGAGLGLVNPPITNAGVSGDAAGAGGGGVRGHLDRQADRQRPGRRGDGGHAHQRVPRPARRRSAAGRGAVRRHSRAVGAGGRVRRPRRGGRGRDQPAAAPPGAGSNHPGGVMPGGPAPGERWLRKRQPESSVRSSPWTATRTSVITGLSVTFRRVRW